VGVLAAGVAVVAAGFAASPFFFALAAAATAFSCAFR
jgi:hypothetical protein